MSVRYLPEQITKEDLLRTVQNKLMLCAKMFWDSSVTAQQMYEEVSCSCLSGDPELDFPEIVGPKKVIRYHYNNGACFFMIDGIEVEVLALRDMCEDPSIGFERYSDVCIPSISYTDTDDNFIHHPIPNAWLYGSTSSEFDEGKPVHKEFIDAAREYIKEHEITPELQKYLE